MIKTGKGCFLHLIPCLLPIALFAQVNVLTQHNNNARTGANLHETSLTTQNVSAASFGKLFEYKVTGQVYAQPLYVTALDFGEKGIHNVVYVATMHNEVYAFDADDSTQAIQPLWQVNLGPAVPLPDTKIGIACGVYQDILQEVGILSTPVIDLNSNTIYLVAKTKESGNYIDRIHALDVRTGAEKFGGPSIIQGAVTGNGDGSQNGQVNFLSVNENQRSSLLLQNGIVYLAYAGYCDTPPYHGWIFGYDASNLAEPKIIFNTTPNGGDGGIWMSGQGPATDSLGDLYVITGNGDFNALSKNFGDCFLRLHPTGNQLVPVDYFSPYNQSYLQEMDLDLGSDGPMIVPNSNLVTGSGKEGILYLLNRDELGKFNIAHDTCLERFYAFPGQLHGSTVYWEDDQNNGLTYWWSQRDNLKAYRLSNGVYDSLPYQTGPKAPQGTPGAMLSVSSDGSIDGTAILWTSMPISESAVHTTVSGILRAFDATNVSRELWNSQQVADRDSVGNFAKFCSPTIANGHVYLATFSDKVNVYGLFPPAPKLLDAVEVLDPVKGLEYKFYEGNWSTLPDFTSLQPTGAGITDEIDLSPAASNTQFGIVYTGYINVPSDGVYTFYLASDAGSKLTVGDIQLINNDGSHKVWEASGGIGLKAGNHAIKIQYFENADIPYIALNWEGPGFGKQPVPAEDFVRTNIEQDDVYISPNPVTSNLKIITGNAIPQGYYWEVLNSVGQLITKGRITGNETTLAVNAWQKGVYYFKLQPVNGKTIVKRFVKL